MQQRSADASSLHIRIDKQHIHEMIMYSDKAEDLFLFPGNEQMSKRIDVRRQRRFQQTDVGFVKSMMSGADTAFPDIAQLCVVRSAA